MSLSKTKLTSVTAVQNPADRVWATTPEQLVGVLRAEQGRQACPAIFDQILTLIIFIKLKFDWLDPRRFWPGPGTPPAIVFY